MKIRLSNYYIAYFIYLFIKSFWWGIFRKSCRFYECSGLDYREIKRDEYYFLQFRL